MLGWKLSLWYPAAQLARCMMCCCCRTKTKEPRKPKALAFAKERLCAWWKLSRKPRAVFLRFTVTSSICFLIKCHFSHHGNAQWFLLSTEFIQCYPWIGVRYRLEMHVISAVNNQATFHLKLAGPKHPLFKVVTIVTAVIGGFVNGQHGRSICWHPPWHPEPFNSV